VNVDSVLRRDSNETRKTLRTLLRYPASLLLRQLCVCVCLSLCLCLCLTHTLNLSLSPFPSLISRRRATHARTPDT